MWLVSSTPIQVSKVLALQRMPAYFDKVWIQLNRLGRICDTIAISFHLYLRLCAVAVEDRIRIILLDRSSIEVNGGWPVVLFKSLVALIFQCRCSGTIFRRSHDVDAVSEDVQVRATARGVEDLRKFLCYRGIMFFMSLCDAHGGSQCSRAWPLIP